MNKSLITIGIPSYNHQDYIIETLQSIISQNYENIELIIIDDGSKDNSRNIIKMFEKDLKKRFVHYTYIEQENQGVSYTLNKILELAKGKYICFSASDDTQPLNRIEEMSKFLLENPNYDFCYAGYNNIRKDGSISLTVVPEEDYDITFDEALMRTRDIAYFNYMAKVDSFRKIGGFKKDIKIEDWELVLRVLSNKLKAKFISKSLYNHRFHGENTTFNYEYMKQGRLEVIADYKNYPKYKEAINFWINHYNKIYYYNFMNNFFLEIEKLNNNFNIIIYGNGNIGKLVSKIISNSNYCFIDKLSKNTTKNSFFIKGEIYSKDSINYIKFDYIIISPFYANDNISHELINKYKIKKEKIIYI